MTDTDKLIKSLDDLPTMAERYPPIDLAARHERMAEAMCESVDVKWSEAKEGDRVPVEYGRPFWRMLARVADVARGDGR